MVRPTFQSAFVQHLLALIKARLSSDDADLASKLVDSAKNPCHAANLLASALFIYKVGRISHVPRQLAFSRIFTGIAVSPDDRPHLDQLLNELRTGGAALERARSNQAHSALCRSKGSAFIFLDRCFLNWGVHHFHVHPTERKRDLLVYAAFDEHFVYLLSLGGHVSLHDQNLVSAMGEVCPHLLTTAKGVAGDALSTDAVKNLRAKNVAFATPSDHGAVIPRVLCSAGGTSLQAGRDVDRMFAWLETLQTALDDPSAKDYCAVQRALGASEELHLSVVPDESNFRGSVLVRDDRSGTVLRLNYGDKAEAFHASWE